MKNFVIDCRLCIGCYNCQIACKDENCGNDWTPYAKPQPDTGHYWRRIKEETRGTIPKVKVSFVPWMCQHCDDAPCMKVCPVDAIYKRPDGLVIIDPKLCNGCRNCMDACPYESIYYNETLSLAQKCTGCAHLVDRGWPIKEPRCADVCWGATKFGEESEFPTQKSKAEQLLPEKNTKPRVIYLNIPNKKWIAGTVYNPGTKQIIEGATCTLSGAGSGTVTTDGFGDFWFNGLQVGTYSVKIDAAGKTKTIPDISTAKDVNLGDIALA